MSITVKHKGRNYVWHKHKRGWFTDTGRRVTSKTLKDRLDQLTCELS